MTPATRTPDARAPGNAPPATPARPTDSTDIRPKSAPSTGGAPDPTPRTPPSTSARPAPASEAAPDPKTPTGQPVVELKPGNEATIWRAVMERATSRRLRTVLADTRLLSITDEAASIESGPTMEALVLQHASEIEGLLRAVVGRPLRLEITQREATAEAPRAPAAEPDEPVDHPLVDRAMQLFGEGGNV